MTTRFFDRQESSNPRHGKVIEDSESLATAIDELRERPASFCELESQNGFKLLMGIGRDRGCAQYSTADGGPPYLMALDDNRTDTDDYMEFLIGNTDTPVQMQYCLPIDQIKAIAREFVTTGKRSPRFQWEEI